MSDSDRITGEIEKEHIEPGSQKEIGRLGKDPVFKMRTKGGYHMVVCMKDKKVKTLGLGPLEDFALMMAEDRNPDMVVTELRKSDPSDREAYSHLVPRYNDLIDLFNKAE